MDISSVQEVFTQQKNGKKYKWKKHREGPCEQLRLLEVASGSQLPNFDGTALVSSQRQSWSHLLTGISCFKNKLFPQKHSRLLRHAHCYCFLSSVSQRLKGIRSSLPQRFLLCHQLTYRAYFRAENTASLSPAPSYRTQKAENMTPALNTDQHTLKKYKDKHRQVLVHTASRAKTNLLELSWGTREQPNFPFETNSAAHADLNKCFNHYSFSAN